MSDALIALPNTIVLIIVGGMELLAGIASALLASTRVVRTRLAISSMYDDQGPAEWALREMLIYWPSWPKIRRKPKNAVSGFLPFQALTRLKCRAIPGPGGQR